MHNLKQNKNKKIFVYAHRGVPESYPENTMISFLEAVSLEYDGVELDVLITKDKKLIVFHDKKINHLNHQVLSLEYNTIKQTFLKKENPFEVPLLNEVLEKIGHKTILNLEIKNQGTISKTEVIYKTIKSLKKYNLVNNIIISSFSPSIIKQSKKIDDRYKTAWIWGKKNYHAYSSCKFFLNYYQADRIHLHHSLATKRLINRIQKRNKKIFVYTVNQASLLKKLQLKNIDGIFTDSPKILKLSRKTDDES